MRKVVTFVTANYYRTSFYGQIVMNKRIKQTLFSALMLAMASTTMGYTVKRVSVHDPSIVWEPQSKTYYIFGSHRAAAKSTDLIYWNSLKAPWATATSSNATDAAAFKTQAVKTVNIGGEDVEFPNFDAYAWSKASDADWSIGGNMWAPDVIWNKKMQKWCMYLSINGLDWRSSIILLTADNIAGPYLYQGPVLVSGFTVNGASYKNMDLELVLGKLQSVPSRYTSYWGRRWPHCIDPCVFYDEEGRLWMSYGSWSGGIWILELDEETGLRDYNVKYSSVGGSTDGVTSDPYFGKKIAGGFYSSGEGSYIEYVGGYYYLFISNGGLDVGGKSGDYNYGGYQMRVFRSQSPDGPYRDAQNQSAVYPNYLLNFGNGTGSVTRGINIFGAYGNWGYQATGDKSERSQGHNSIIAAEDGRTYLVYHTRFQNFGGAHEVRVHQVFQNQEGWLVAAPFEYTGEQVKSADIATTQQIAADQIPGVYQLLVHKYKLDHTKKELVTPVEIQLNADGTITGAYTGKWEVVEGTSYVNVTLQNTLYKGVMVEQTMEPRSTKVAAFTVLAKSGVTAWGYKSGDLPVGIRAVQSDSQDNVWFDLQGRRVNTPRRSGVYVRDGRKWVIR